MEFFRASGPGGQHRNKRETAVRLTHVPSGLVVTATEHRSQHLNREQAFARLAAELIRRQKRPKTRHQTRPTRGSVVRRLRSKQKTGQKKRLRQKPGRED